MSGSCPTTKVASDTHDDGFYVINTEDFDPEVHTLFVEPGEEPAKQPAAAKQPRSKK